MRTKTLLLTAALTAAGALSSMAQVYSVNIVGYINLSIPAGYSMIANQLNNQPDNKIATILASGVPDSTTVYKFNGTGYDIDDYIQDVGWDFSGNITLNPGEGCFIHAPSPFTATFVGEVQLVSSPVITKGYSIMSSVIPQAGVLDTDLGLVPVDSDTVYQWGGTGYIINDYIQDVGWDFNPPPTLRVGESFFFHNAKSLAGDPARNWSRTFVVGPP